MKNIACFLLLTLISVSAFSSEETSTGLKTVGIQTDLLPDVIDLFHEVNVDFSFGIGDRVTLGPTFEYWNSSGFSPLSDTYRLSGKSYTPGIRATFFLSNERFMDSWVVSPSIEYVAQINPADSYFSDNSGAPAVSDEFSSAYRLGLQGGYQWVYRSGLSLALLTGVYDTYWNPQTVSFTDGTLSDNPSTNEFTIEVSVKVGYVF